MDQQWTCPECKTQITSENLPSPVEDKLVCPACGVSSAVWKWNAATYADEDVLRNPPAGAWFHRDEDKTVIGVSLRSGLAVIVMCFLGAIFGVITLVGLSKSEVASFSALAVVLVAFGWVIVTIIFGKAEVTIEDGVGRLFVGLGGMGRSRYFQWDQVTAISSVGGDIILKGEGEDVSFRKLVANLLTWKRMSFLRHGLMRLKREEMGF
jgi:hypothetical protein